MFFLHIPTSSLPPLTLFHLSSPSLPQGVTIHGGAPLFIFDENTAVILGIFQKATPTDLLDTVDTAAFHGQLPLQLRFSIVLEAPPLHIQDPEFMVRDSCVCVRESVSPLIHPLLSSPLLFIQSVFPSGPAFGPIGLKETKQLANIFATRVGAMPMGK